MHRYDRVLGAFLGAAVGDAMGAITETLPIEYILANNGGYVRSFLPVPDYTIAAGQPLGSVTDDYSMADALAKAIIESGGILSDPVADRAVLNWHDEGRYLSMMGPTIYECVQRLKGQAPSRKQLAVDNGTATNGAAMKVFPAGLLAGGDVEKAIEYAIVASRNSHGNSAGLAGACAVSAAVAAAMREDADVAEIVQAGIHGAEMGHRAGVEMGRQLAVPLVSEWIRIAVEIAEKSPTVEAAMWEIRDIVGCGLWAYQSVPAAFGIFAAAKGDPQDTLFGTVNIGDDSDTVATMACAIAGAFHGAGAFRPEYIGIINRSNGYDIEARARAFYSVMK